MAGLTAIELGADACTMVRTAVRGTQVRVLDVETIDPAALPGPDGFATALRYARRTKKLPRRARVVLWGLQDGANPRDPSVAPLLIPLKRAGFRIERAVSPCNALAALARVRAPRGDGAVAWLAINRGGVAIAVVRPGALLHAHEFAWDSSMGATGSQARLLQRYSLVAFLEPEVRRAMAAAAAKGARVEAIVTCGNLPDLRSLTMPLIEELDLEVETLDSFDGLTLKPSLRDALADAAPALRIACAGALARVSRPHGERPQRFTGGMLFRAAALGVAAVAIGWLWLGPRAPVNPVAPAVIPAKTAAPQPKAQPPARQAAASPGATTTTPQPRPAAPPAATATAPTPASSKPAGPVAAVPPLQGKAVPAPQPKVVAPRPASTMPPASARGAQPVQAATPATPKPAPVIAQPTAAPPKTAAAQAKSAPVVTRPTAAASKPALVTTRPTPPPQHAAPKASAPPPVVAGRARADTPDPGRLPAGPDGQSVLLKDALPHISTILVAEDRRFAVLDGRTVSVGDTVGQRVVTAIEPRAVVLREPSGVQIRVGLGGRFLGIQRGGR